MFIPLTPVLTLLYIVIFEVYLQCCTESVILRDKPASRAELSGPSSLYFKAVKRAHLFSFCLNVYLMSPQFSFEANWEKESIVLGT